MLFDAGLRKVEDDAFQLDLFRLLPSGGKGLFGWLLGFLCGLLFQPFPDGMQLFDTIDGKADLAVECDVPHGHVAGDLANAFDLVFASVPFDDCANGYIGRFFCLYFFLNGIAYNGFLFIEVGQVVKVKSLQLV